MPRDDPVCGVPEWPGASLRTVPGPALPARARTARPGHRPALRRDLADRAGPPGLAAPANAVLVELPEADLAGGRDRYAVADRPVHPLAGRGDPRGRPRAQPLPLPHDRHRRGAPPPGSSARWGWPNPGAESDILPHEQTLPKPKSDRLDLLRATRANLSPIWGLSMASGVTATFDPTDDEPVADAYDDDGVRHQLWVLSDPDAVAAVGAAAGHGAGRPGRRAPPLRDGPGLPGGVPRRPTAAGPGPTTW